MNIDDYLDHSLFFPHFTPTHFLISSFTLPPLYLTSHIEPARPLCVCDIPKQQVWGLGAGLHILIHLIGSCSLLMLVSFSMHCTYCRETVRWIHEMTLYCQDSAVLLTKIPWQNASSFSPPLPPDITSELVTCCFRVWRDTASRDDNDRYTLFFLIFLSFTLESCVSLLLHTVCVRTDMHSSDQKENPILPNTTSWLFDPYRTK